MASWVPGLVGGVAGLVGLLARGDAGGEQRLLASGFALGVGQGLAGGGDHRQRLLVGLLLRADLHLHLLDLGLRLGGVGLGVAGVEAEEAVAGMHDLVLGDEHLDNAAVDAGAHRRPGDLHVGVVGGLGLAGVEKNQVATAMINSGPPMISGQRKRRIRLSPPLAKAWGGGGGVWAAG